MPINSNHPSYTANSEAWTRCRDVVAGEQAVKKAGTKYLPRLSAQSPTDYENYKLRATFFNIVGKTLVALVGLAMTKPVIEKHDEQLDRWFKDGEGMQLNELIGYALHEILLMGRIGLLVDAPVGGGQPTISTYAAESIINWSVSGDKLEWVVLKELIEKQNASDQFVTETEVQYRLLAIINGIYMIQTFDKAGQATSMPITPTIDNRPIDYIPFLVINASSTGMGVEKPPMEDIANLNLSLYRTSADLEWGRHFTGLPTPVVSGVDGSTVLTIGGTNAWVLPDAQGKAYYLEFTGQGLQSLEKAITEKQGQLASMSARMIDQSTRGSESAEAVRMRYLSESATLTQACQMIEKGINVVYSWLSKFVGTGAPTITMPKEFLGAKLTPAELTALTESYLKGTIDKATYIYNLRRGDMLDPNRPDEDVVNSIVTESGAEVTKPTITQPVVSTPAAAPENTQ